MNYVLYLVIPKDTPFILSNIKTHLTFTPPKKPHLPKLQHIKKKPLYLNKTKTHVKVNIDRQ